MHLFEEKINTHLAFIESGQIYESYPKAEGKELVIRIIRKYDMT